MPQASLQLQGTQRRAYGPGANWNVEVVRGKATTRCLWNACKALGIGIVLFVTGSCMAVIGFYSDDLSEAQEVRGNVTIRVKNESRSFHLNSFSYAGPIVMGFGGFIVVAACVMTFEARDNAAKVGPARYRFSQASTIRPAKSQKNRKSTSSQTSKWDQQLGLFLVNRSPSPSIREVSRKQLTAELLQFSKNLQDKNVNPALKRSPSAPTLVEKKSPRKKPTKPGGCSLLNAELLKRHAMSVDNPSYNPRLLSPDALQTNHANGSQVSMVMDLHLPNKGPITLRVKDRSDTARRHQLARQTKIEDAEDLEEAKRTAAQIRSHSPKLPGNYRYPEDFVPRKRNSIDLKTLEELVGRDFARTSLRDFRKVSSPNFRKMSLDKIGSERRFDKTMMGFRKASLDFRKSPDFRKSDYRKYSIERFTADCVKYLGNEAAGEVNTSKTPANYSGESASVINYRRSRYPKLFHSRSDDNRARSFERQMKESHQSSRYSLNTQDKQPDSDFELKYFAKTSLDTEESLRLDNSDESHMVEYDELFGAGAVTATLSGSEAAGGLGPDGDTLLEEPELEHLQDINVILENEEQRRALRANTAHYAKQETLSPDETDGSEISETIHETKVCIEREDVEDSEDNTTIAPETTSIDTVIDVHDDKQ